MDFEGYRDVLSGKELSMYDVDNSLRKVFGEKFRVERKIREISEKIVNVGSGEEVEELWEMQSKLDRQLIDLENSVETFNEVYRGRVIINGLLDIGMGD